MHALSGEECATVGMRRSGDNSVGQSFLPFSLRTFPLDSGGRADAASPAAGAFTAWTQVKSKAKDAKPNAYKALNYANLWQQNNYY